MHGMTTYFIRRILLIPITFICITFLVYAVQRLTPGGPIERAKMQLQQAMMGMVVVPIFGGYDLRRECGRLWDYDATGGRYEERDYVATGSGSLHAGTVEREQQPGGARPGGPSDRVALGAVVDAVVVTHPMADDIFLDMADPGVDGPADPRRRGRGRPPRRAARPRARRS